MSEVCLFFQTISTTLLALLIFFGGLVLLLSIVARIERWMWAMSSIAAVCSSILPFMVATSYF